MIGSLQLRALFEGGKPRAPQSLVDAYPDLRERVTEERRTLF